MNINLDTNWEGIINNIANIGFNKLMVILLFLIGTFLLIIFRESTILSSLGIFFIIIGLFYVIKDDRKSIYDENTSMNRHHIFIELERLSKSVFNKKDKFMSFKYKVWLDYLKEDITEHNQKLTYEVLMNKQEKAIKKYEKV